jgi:hypothetical protein
MICQENYPLVLNEPGHHLSRFFFGSDSTPPLTLGHQEPLLLLPCRLKIVSVTPSLVGLEAYVINIVTKKAVADVYQFRWDEVVNMLNNDT